MAKATRKECLAAIESAVAMKTPTHIHLHIGTCKCNHVSGEIKNMATGNSASFCLGRRETILDIRTQLMRMILQLTMQSTLINLIESCEVAEEEDPLAGTSFEVPNPVFKRPKKKGE